MNTDPQSLSSLKHPQYLILQPGAMNGQLEDEIDLVDLLKTLLSSKLKLLAITFSFILVSLIAVFVISPTYKSKAILSAPSVSDINQLIPMPIKDFDLTPLSLFDRASMIVKSQVSKKAFYDQYISHSKKNDSELFEDFEKQLQTNNPLDKDTNSHPLVLSYEGDNETQVPSILKGYIDFANKRTLQSVQNDFMAYKSSQIDQLESKINQLRAEEKNRLISSIVNYSNALTIAKSLNVKNPIQSVSGLVNDATKSGAETMPLNFSRIPLYSLGSKYLEKKLDELKSTKNIDTNISELPGLLAELGALKTIKMYPEKAKAFTFLAEPLSPAKKVKPKRSLIVTLAGILGFFFAIFYVLIESKIRNTSSKEKAL
jgi:chain length determinant protein (polysaccharide antigen chain regulator)